MKKNKLATEFLGVPFSNPLVLPSGIIQELSSYKSVLDQGVGGVVGKSLTKEPREGNPIPRVIKYKEIGILNSVGLRNPGIDKGIEQLNTLIKSTKTPVIASIFAVSVSDFVYLAKKILKVNSPLIELNLSCPNTVDELGKPLQKGVESTFQTVSAIRKAIGNKHKLIAKISADVSDIAETAKAAEKAGADAISVTNTIGPGMIIDIKTKKPILGNKKGGMSGPIIKPLAIRCVYEIFEVVTIPILGMGGISTWEDTVEMMMAGATLVGVGSAWYFNKNVYSDIQKGLLEYLNKHKIKSVSDLVGVAH